MAYFLLSKDNFQAEAFDGILENSRKIQLGDLFSSSNNYVSFYVLFGETRMSNACQCVFVIFNSIFDVCFTEVCHG